MKRVFILLIACLITVGCSSEPTAIPKFKVGDILCMEGMSSFRMKVSHIPNPYTTNGNIYYAGIPAYGDRYLRVKESELILCTQENPIENTVPRHSQKILPMLFDDRNVGYADGSRRNSTARYSRNYV